MKKLLFIVLIALVSCEKEPDPVPEVKYSVNGELEYYVVSTHYGTVTWFENGNIYSYYALGGWDHKFINTHESILLNYGEQRTSCGYRIGVIFKGDTLIDVTTANPLDTRIIFTLGDEPEYYTY